MACSRPLSSYRDHASRPFAYSRSVSGSRDPWRDVASVDSCFAQGAIQTAVVTTRASAIEVHATRGQYPRDGARAASTEAGNTGAAELGSAECSCGWTSGGPPGDA